MRRPHDHADPEKPAQSAWNRDMARAVRELQDGPLVGGQLLASTTLASGANSVQHKLGRTARGWFPVYKSANVDLHDTAKPDDDFLYITASGAVTVLIYVF